MDDQVFILARDDSHGTQRSWWLHAEGLVMARCPSCGTPATLPASSLGPAGESEFHCAAPRCKHAALIKLDGWPIKPPPQRIRPPEEATAGG